MKRRASTFILIVASMVLGAIIGVGVYETLFTMPAWFVSPPHSFALIAAHTTKTANRFWIPLQAILLVQLLVGLVLNWKNTKRRKLLMGVLGCYLSVIVVSITYFVPEIMTFIRLAETDSSPSPELFARGKQWLRLSWSRHALFLFGQLLLLLAISTSPDQQNS